MKKKISVIIACCFTMVLTSEVSPIWLSMVNSDFIFSLEYNMRKNQMILDYEYRLENSRHFRKQPVLLKQKKEYLFDHYLEKLLPSYFDEQNIRKYVKEEYTFLKVYSAEIKFAPNKKKFLRISFPLEFNGNKKKKK